MENHNALTLAEISFEGKNYFDAYSKYSTLIENDITNTQAWVGKGLSAGYLSDSSKSTLEEAKICLNYALKHNISDIQRTHILNHLIPIAENYIRALISKARGIVGEKAKEPLSTFQLQLTRNVQQTADRYEANNQVFDLVYSALEFTNLGIEFSASEEYFKKQVELIDTYLVAINSELHEEKKLKLFSQRGEIVNRIKKTDSSYTTKEPPKGGGCFIATEIYGNELHPNILVLRNFRDIYLLNSRFGRRLISVYYKHSPLIASRISGKNGLKRLIKFVFIHPLVWAIKKFN